MPEPVAILGPLTLEDVARARWVGPTVFVEPDPRLDSGLCNLPGGSRNSLRQDAEEVRCGGRI